jgi:hypothetical protein
MASIPLEQPPTDDDRMAEWLTRMMILIAAELDSIENSGGGGDSTVWGTIIGTLSDQLDLQAALDEKVEEAPIDGTPYSREDASWVPAGGGGGYGPGDIILAGYGTENFPGHAFDGEPSNGIYRVSSGVLGVSTLGTRCATFSSSGNSMQASLNFGGTNDLLNPKDPTSGTGVGSRNYNDGRYMQIGAGYQDGSTIRAALGSANSPGLSFNGDTSTGFWSQVGIINVVTGGGLRFNISSLGIGMAGQIAMNNNSINNPSNPVNANGVGDRGYNDLRYLQLSGGSMTGFINMQNGANRINNSPEPVNNLDVANKIYVINTASDPRLKTNKFLVSEASILDLNVYEFEYIETDLINTTSPKFRTGKHFGVMSDEAAAISADITHPMPSDLDDEGVSVTGENYQAVDDQGVLYLLLEEVKKLRARIEVLESP